MAHTHQDTTDHTSSAYPPGASCSIKCIYHLVNVLLMKEIYILVAHGQVFINTIYIVYLTTVLRVCLMVVGCGYKSWVVGVGVGLGRSRGCG